MKRLIWLFNPPAGATSAEMRKAGLFGLVLGVVLIAFGMGFVAWFVRHPDAGTALKEVAEAQQREMQARPTGGLGPGGALMFAFFAAAGIGYMLFVAALHRTILGAPLKGAVFAFGRWMLAIALFVVTLMASLVIYGQVNP